jgi:hypothetical protein
MRFDNYSPVRPLVQTVSHVASEAEDLDYELANRKFNVPEPSDPNPNPSPEGIRVAMTGHNGAPVELTEFKFINKNKI